MVMDGLKPFHLLRNNLRAGEVYVVANSSSDDVILAEADVSYAYGSYDPDAGTAYIASFNGDDVRALAMAADPTVIMDIIGTLDGDGDGVDGEEVKMTLAVVLTLLENQTLQQTTPPKETWCYLW